MISSRTCSILTTSFIVFVGHGQSVYNDVAVIVNINDPVSVTIGNYFQAARGIPAINMILIDAPLSETIDAAQFNDLRQQIEAHLIANDMVDSINFMVTTKGIPNRVSQSACDTIPFTAGCTSFDSEITLILGPESSQILSTNWVNSPYFGSTIRQQRSLTGVYLVTRLDGYNENDVLDLIDRSGPGLMVDKALTSFIGDVSHADAPIIYLANYNMFDAILEPIESIGWTTYIDTLAAPLVGTSGVLGLLSYEEQPTTGLVPYQWANGALAFEFYAQAAASFDPGLLDPVRLRAADLIASGATGVVGAANYTYASAWSGAIFTFQRYVDTLGFGLAESYYAGIRYLSDMSVVVGDPKTSLVISNTTAINESPSQQFQIHYDPNTSSITFAPFHLSTVSPYHIQLFDPVGHLLLSRALMPSDQVSVASLAPGAYVVRVGMVREVFGAGRFVKY